MTTISLAPVVLAVPDIGANPASTVATPFAVTEATQADVNEEANAVSASDEAIESATESSSAAPDVNTTQQDTTQQSDAREQAETVPATSTEAKTRRSLPNWTKRPWGALAMQSLIVVGLVSFFSIACLMILNWDSGEEPSHELADIEPMQIAPENQPKERINPQQIFADVQAVGQASESPAVGVTGGHERSDHGLRLAAPKNSVNGDPTMAEPLIGKTPPLTQATPTRNPRNVSNRNESPQYPDTSPLKFRYPPHAAPAPDEARNGDTMATLRGTIQTPPLRAQR